jgi:hypothetical protein
VGLRPLVCLAKCWYYTTVLSFLIYAREGGKDKRSTGETRAQSPLWLRLEFELSLLSCAQNHLDFDFAAAAYVYNSKSGKATTTIGKAVNTNVPDAQMASMRARHRRWNLGLDSTPPG